MNPKFFAFWFLGWAVQSKSGATTNAICMLEIVHFFQDSFEANTHIEVERSTNRFVFHVIYRMLAFRTLGHGCAAFV